MWNSNLLLCVLTACLAGTAFSVVTVSPRCKAARASSKGNCACLEFSDAVSATQCSGTEAGPVPLPPALIALMEDFASPDPQSSDSAYLALFDLASSSSGPGQVPYLQTLWQLANNPANLHKRFGGSSFVNYLSSAPEPVLTVAHAALLLFDSITHSTPQPYSDPQLASIDMILTDNRNVFAEALTWYGDWLNDLPTAFLFKQTALTYARSAPPRLPPTGFECPYLPRPQVSESFLTRSAAIWGGDIVLVSTAVNVTRWLPKRVNGSETLRGGLLRKGNHSWIYIYEATNTTGSTPYNCIAWALGHNDSWYWPGTVLQMECDKSKPISHTDYSDMLMEDGYDAAVETPCSGSCPSGKGPKVMMIFSFDPVTCKWKLVHGMRKDDSTWSSKNGQTQLYEGITDGEVDDFLDTFYPDPNREKKCYCKK